MSTWWPIPVDARLAGGYPYGQPDSPMAFFMGQVVQPVFAIAPIVVPVAVIPHPPVPLLLPIAPADPVVPIVYPPPFESFYGPPWAPFLPSPAPAPAPLNVHYIVADQNND